MQNSYIPYTLNLGGKLFSLDAPVVMGILNVTPDSFYAHSRQQGDEAVRRRARQIVNEGAALIDIGAYSSRPGADDVTPSEEMQRLRTALRLVREEVGDVPVSVDTFRADVARMCVEEYGVAIVNDISGGEMDAAMFSTVARLGVPYILMHMQGTPRTMQLAPHYDDLQREVFLYFSERVNRLRALGVKDVIVDPGFGFGKSLEQNYTLMAHLADFHELAAPLLVGVSRKSMIYRLLNTDPDGALTGTTALHAIALQQGAHILRVHDVAEAVQVVAIHRALQAAV